MVLKTGFTVFDFVQQSDEDDSDGVRNRVRQSSQRTVHIPPEEDEEKQLHLVSGDQEIMTVHIHGQKHTRQKCQLHCHYAVKC